MRLFAGQYGTKRTAKLTQSKTGKVGIWSCWQSTERKTNRYEYIIDEETGQKKRSGFIYKKGDKYKAEKNVDGEFHHELMTMKADAAIDQPDGLLESARKYFGKKKRPCNQSIQQDQAGGHAVYGEWSEKIEAERCSQWQTSDRFS